VLSISEGVAEDGYVLYVEPGKTYLLRIINTGLFSEFFLKIAGHRFTVVASDANYVSPYTTDLIVIAPGETVDALIVADAPPDKYYMVAMPNQAPLTETQTPEPTTRGIVQYRNHHMHSPGSNGGRGPSPISDAPVAPVMPDQHDVVLSTSTETLPACNTQGSHCRWCPHEWTSTCLSPSA
jgi:laccase